MAVNSGDGATYRTKRGETLEDRGETILRGREEQGVMRRARSSRANVHNMLIAGSAARKFQLVCIMKRGRHLIPKERLIASERVLRRLIRKHGDKILIP